MTDEQLASLVQAIDRLLERHISTLVAAIAATKQSEAGADNYCPSRAELSRATGYTKGQLTVIARHARLHDDQRINPFRGRGGWPARVHAYVLNEPTALAWAKAAR